MIARAFEIRSLDNPATFANPHQYFRDMLDGGSASDAGVVVSQETAVLLSAVWRAVRILSETMASLPLFVFERQDPRGRRRASDHPVTELLHGQPNPNMTAFFLREFLMAGVVLQGNAYAAIRRDRAARPREIWPLMPGAVEPKISPVDGTLFYKITLTDGSVEVWEQESVLHVPGLSFDGVKGKSVLRVARDSIGLGLAAQKYGSKFFARGARVPGVIELPATVQLKPEARTNLQTDWNNMVGSPETWHKVPILDRGMTYKQIGVPPDDGQFLETRKFQVTDIARWFGVPPHKLADMERATFSNIEQQALEFVIDTVRPWAVRWEMEYRRKLLLPSERSRFFIEHVLDGLMRGDSVARGTFYGFLRQWGVASANDIRELENMPDLGPKGDIYLSPINMFDAEELANGGLDVAPAPGDAGNAARRLPSAGAIKKAAGFGIRGLRLRRRIRNAQRPILEDMSRAVIRAETAVVRSAVKRLLSTEAKGHRLPSRRGIADFQEWVEQFYAARPAELTRKSLPVLRGYAEVIAAAAAEEIGADAEDQLSPELEKFVRDYSVSFGEREATISKEQILSLLLEADEAASADAIDKRMDEWEEKRPEKIALRESVQMMNAVVKEVFVLAGVTTLIWVASANSCPFCQVMDGKSSQVDSAFVNANDSVAGGDDGAAPLRPSRDIGHPPLHSGCECNIVAG